MPASDLLDLAARCEAASGGDRTLDANIADVLMLPLDWGMSADRYTASLDAAMTLVPKGCTWGVFDDGNAWVWPDATRDLLRGFQSKAATPALALTAASLRARARAAS